MVTFLKIKMVNVIKLQEWNGERDFYCFAIFGGVKNTDGIIELCKYWD